jgi:hypothetical protein
MSKSEGNSNKQLRDLEIRVCFGFRVSDFGFYRSAARLVDTPPLRNTIPQPNPKGRTMRFKSIATVAGLLVALSVATSTLPGCSKSEPPAPPTTGASGSQTSGISPEDEALVRAAISELQAKGLEQEKAWQLSTAKANVDIANGTIAFHTSAGATLTAPIQVIGTYSTTESTWMWSWSNNTIGPNLTEHARRVRDYGTGRTIASFTSPVIMADNNQCWALSAVTCKLNGAAGVYAVPASEKLVVFLTFGDLKVTTPAPATEPTTEPRT